VGDVSLNLKGTNTVEEFQGTSNPDPLAFTFWAVQDPVSGAVTVYTGTPDPANGNTNLTPTTLIPVIVPLSDTTWTADDNDGATDHDSDPVTPDKVIMSVGENPLFPSTLTTPIGPADQNAAPLIIKSKINGSISVNFFCWPGSSVAPGTTLTPGASSAVSSLEVLVPPLPPVCGNVTTSAPAAQAIEINLNTVCSDPNGNIDPATWSVSTPSAGALAPVAGQPGKYTYTAPATDPGVPATFTFQVSDTLDRTEGPFTSAAATASITILGNLCNATTGSCPLRQVITTPVFGATKTLEQAGSSITMIDAASIAGPDGIPGTLDDTLATAAPIVLNGNPQLAVGNLNELTVTNARGDDAGWTVHGQVSSFLDVLRYPDRSAAGVPACLASDDTTWDNHCIPGDNLGWTPSSAVAHTVIPGDVASSSGGTPLFPPGFFTNTDTTGGVTGDPTGLATSAQTLCSAPSMQSGGTFTCNAGLGLAVPASAAAGAYVAVLTLTLS
jgi:hypothetical protein